MPVLRQIRSLVTPLLRLHLIRPGLRRATFPSRGRLWLVRQITICRSNDTERAVRLQGIGNHTIM